MEDKILGVDLSKHNGEVNFEELKANGIKFCMIRLGFGNNEEFQDDSQFERNVAECERLQIPYGVYIYSYATTENEAYSEVDHTLRQIKKCGEYFKLGAYIDMEDADNYKRNRDALNSELLSTICYIYCFEMKKYINNVGIYASKYWFKTYLTDKNLDTFERWLAHWTDKTDFDEDFLIWQFTSDYKINGKRYDANYLMKDVLEENIDNSEEKNNNENTKERLNRIIKELQEISVNL